MEEKLQVEKKEVKILPSATTNRSFLSSPVILWHRWYGHNKQWAELHAQVSCEAMQFPWPQTSLRVHLLKIRHIQQITPLVHLRIVIYLLSASESLVVENFVHHLKLHSTPRMKYDYEKRQRCICWIWRIFKGALSRRSEAKEIALLYNTLVYEAQPIARYVPSTCARGCLDFSGMNGLLWRLADTFFLTLILTSFFRLYLFHLQVYKRDDEDKEKITTCIEYYS